MTYSHGVFPLVYNTLKIYDSLLPNEKLSYMKKIYMDIVKENMLMTSELIKVMKLFEENDIKAIPFKGPVLSQVAYGDVISRQYVDLDILVKDKDLVKAYDLLEYNDFNSELEKKFFKNQLFLEKNSDISFYNSRKNITIELHWKLFAKQFLSNINITNIFNKKEHLYINKNKINIFQNELLIVYLCMHGSKHCWERIEWILDIDKMIRNAENINWELVFYLAEKNYCTKMLKLGLFISNHIFDSPIPNDVLIKIEEQYFYKKMDYVLNEISNINIYKSEFQKNLSTFKFTYNLNDNIYEKIKFIKRTFFELSHIDVRFIDLNKNFYFIYYLIKPFRLLIKYILKLKK